LAGILGSPKAGKTALLVSLYLLAANGKLEGYKIADSETMRGIDDISRGARRWNQGQVPEEMTIHTELADERTPGFLHLRLRRLNDGKMLDLLLPDLPGEWSDSLIDHKRRRMIRPPRREGVGQRALTVPSSLDRVVQPHQTDFVADLLSFLHLSICTAGVA
jgi:hypothetical protein